MPALVPTYLYLNCSVYLLFAIWCTVSPMRTATALGYSVLSRSGVSEYLVIYGGLQLGLAILFGLLAYDVTRHQLGLMIAVGLYLPIVMYRVITILLQWPVGGLTLATAGLEVLLLVSGAALLLNTR